MLIAPYQIKGELKMQVQRHVQGTQHEEGKLEDTVDISKITPIGTTIDT
jgi:hypothetical protein